MKNSRPRPKPVPLNAGKPWYSFFIAAVSILIGLSVLIDHFAAIDENVSIENMEVGEIITKGKSSYSRTVGYLYDIKATSGAEFEVVSKRNYIESYDSLYVEYTPLYNIVHEVKILRGDATIDLSPPAGIFTLLMVLSLLIIGIPVIALLVKSHDVSIKLLLMNIFIIGILLFIFGGTRYFYSN